MLTEHELRDGLRALGAGVPLAPAGRVEASVRRARFIRSRQVAVAGVAAVAVVVPTVAVLSLSQQRGTDLTSPARWAARYDPAFRPAADKAFRDWDEHNDLGGEQVRWLYAGAVPGTKYVAVAFATCGGDNCSRVVLEFADKAEATVEDGDPASSPWVAVRKELRPSATVPPLAVALSSEQPWGDTGPRSVLFVLPAPGTARVTYESSTLRSGTGGHGDLVEQPDGSFVGDIGYVSSAITVAAYDDDDLLQYGQVGETTTGVGAGNTRWVPSLEPVPGYRFELNMRSQFQNGGEGAMVERPDGRLYTVFLRCAGSAPVTVRTGTVVRSVPCDGAVHRVGPDQPVTGSQISVDFESTDPFTAYASAFGLRD